MAKYICTFGYGQEFGGSYIEFDAPDVIAVRKYMHDNYDDRWSMLYTESEWQRWIERALARGWPIEHKLYGITLGEED